MFHINPEPRIPILCWDTIAQDSVLPPVLKMLYIEASLIDMLCPSTIPQLKRLATAPATWAAATEVPVRVVIGMDVYDADYNSSSLIAKGRRCVSR